MLFSLTSKTCHYSWCQKCWSCAESSFSWSWNGLDGKCTTPAATGGRSHTSMVWDRTQTQVKRERANNRIQTRGNEISLGLKESVAITEKERASLGKKWQIVLLMLSVDDCEWTWTVLAEFGSLVRAELVFWGRDWSDSIRPISKKKLSSCRWTEVDATYHNCS